MHTQKMKQPPQAAKKPQNLEIHGDVRVDDYFWLRDKENPEVIRYLENENDYADHFFKKTGNLREELFKELKARVKEDDSSVPVKYANFLYSVRYEKGQQYPIYSRQRIDDPAKKEEILLNINELAKNENYYRSTGPILSQDQTQMAFGADVNGANNYTFKFKDLTTGKISETQLVDITGNLVWANDNKTVFYAKRHPQTLRSYQIHRLNLETKTNDLIYEESDETFSVGVGKGSAEKYLYISSHATLTSEVRYLEADHPNGEWKVFLPRERDHLYSVDETEDGFYILTNWNAKNYRLMKAQSFNIAKSAWVDVIPHRSDVYIEDFRVYKQFISLEERVNGLMKLSIIDKKNTLRQDISFQDAAYVAGFFGNREYDTDVVRYSFESMRIPSTVFDYDVETKKSVERKRQEVPTYNAELYRTERIFVTARDGKKIPISILMKKDFSPDGKSSGMIYGYGAYGYSTDPGFSAPRISLVDRGFISVLAHIRGGSDLGRSWYDDGRMLNKKNSFYDFIDVTEWLIKNKYIHPKHAFAIGGSAGGLLVGAVTNLRPELYRGIIAEVPFVDVISTMLDTSLPLTTGEFDEWGNPNVKKYYDYIKEYSPYDNVTKNSYPHMFLRTGLHDSQVPYWEPAKWMAKLREHQTNNPVLLLRTDMKVGHGGASGRFDALKEAAEIYSFILTINKDEEKSK